jgi:hypothetical protein
MMNIWLEDDRAIIDEIYTVSAGHPNIVQMICEEMVSEIDKHRGNLGLLDKSHLHQAMQQHSLQEEIVNTFWGQMNDLSRMITLLWPEDKLSMALEEIIDSLKSVGLQSVGIAQTQEALKDLELYCFVSPRNRQYDLVPTQFPKLIREITLTDLEIESLVEKIDGQK